MCFLSLSVSVLRNDTKMILVCSVASMVKVNPFLEAPLPPSDRSVFNARFLTAYSDGAPRTGSLV